MLTRFVRPACLMLTLALVGCGVSPRQNSAPDDAAPGAVFPPEDRAAARALSIGNTAALDEASDPYALALLCSVATAELVGPLQASGALDAEQLAAMKRIVSLYEARTRALGMANGKSAEEIAREMTALRIDEDKRAERGRNAMGCIRRLQ